MKSLEQQLNEAQAEINRLRGLLGDKGKTLKKVQESGLPAVAQERVMKRVAADGTDVDRVITEEKRYLREVGAHKKGKTLDLVEREDLTERMVKGYMAAGLSEKEARLAAGLEDAVEKLSESEKHLYDSAKSIGMSDAAATGFAKRGGRF